MTRSIPCLALTAALASGGALAQSSVNISGTIDIYAGSRQLSGGARSTRIDSGGLTTSQLNFHGVEDLGGGLRAEFVLGMFLRADAGDPGRFAGDVFWGRSSYVGLGGSMGTLRLGRQTTGTFLNFIRTNSYADSATFGPALVQTWINAIAQGPQFLGGGAPAANRALTGVLGTTDTAWNNAIGYTSPPLGSVTLAAQWAPSETAGVGSRKGVSAFYSAGPLSVGLAGESIGTAAVPASGPAAAVLARQSTWLLSAAYAFPFARLGAGYFNTRRDYAAIADDKVTTAYVGASIPAGPGAVLLQTAVSRQSPETGAAVRRTTTAVGYDYSLSKRTDVYAVYMRDRFTGKDSGDSIGIGIRHRF
ncbi:MAG: porin [Burkholderiales bacterium]|nr:porin [Burkholderiales bacterium]